MPFLKIVIYTDIILEINLILISNQGEQILLLGT